MKDKTYTYKELAKFNKQDMSGFPHYRLALLGDCATQHLAIALRGYAFTAGISLDVFDADYNQILSQLIDKSSEMYKFDPDAILLYLCTEKLYHEWCGKALSERDSFAEATYAVIQDYWNYINTNSTAKILQFTFVEYNDGVFGNYACIHRESFIYQLRKLNYLLLDDCSKNKSAFLIDLCGIQTKIGRDNFYDTNLYLTAKIPIMLDALSIISSHVVDVIRCLLGAIVKCIILDLDNTLWGGIIGDDGLSGIEIGELGIGNAFTDFQLWLKELQKRGILLAVCSKNEETIAKEPFEKHSEMILQLNDFSIFVANRDDKVKNIHLIQQTLNIGFDSMVFLDDNPFERDLIRSLIPEVIVPDLPENPEEFISYLQSLNLFETTSFSKDDANRTERYQLETISRSLQQKYSSYEEYLENLEMISSSKPFDKMNIPRIAQLTQRTNQFNLRTTRFNDTEISTIASDSSKITRYFTLEDRIANHGIIGLVILDKQNDDTLFISTFLLSCRVFNRGVEEFIINKIIDIAKEEGFKTVIGEYISSPKNSMVADIYERMDFNSMSENCFFADINNFKYKKTFIKEKKNESQ